MFEITMPKLSDTMTEGRLVSWKKSVGDTVSRGDIIAEVETDKANMELEAFGSGTLLAIRIQPGELVPVGTVMGLIGAPGEMTIPESHPIPAPELTEVEATPFETDRPTPTEPVSPHTPEHRQERAAPVVRRRARELGIDLDKVIGSAPGGRILPEDLDSYLQNTPPSPAPVSVPIQGGPEPGETAPPPLSRMRRAIANTVSEAWRTIPHFYETMEIHMGEAEEVRRELLDSGTHVSLNDMIIKAAALALVKFPQVNASFAGDSIILHDRVNIGIAVKVTDGLLVPVIMNCEKLSLKEISGYSSTLVEKARSGTISQAEISNGTFSISNLGMFGVMHFAAVIHPPQAAILAVGTVCDKLVMKGGRPVQARMMLVTLSADHRVIDGAYAAEFLGELRKNLENPVKLLF